MSCIDVHLASINVKSVVQKKKPNSASTFHPWNQVKKKNCAETPASNTCFSYSCVRLFFSFEIVARARRIETKSRRTPGESNHRKTHYQTGDCTLRVFHAGHKKRTREYKGMRWGAKEKRKHLFGLHLQRRRGPQGLWRIAYTPPLLFFSFLFNFSL